MRGIVEKKFRSTIYGDPLFVGGCFISVFFLYEVCKLFKIKQITFDFIGSVILLIIVIIKLLPEIKKANEKCFTLEICQKGITGFRDNEKFLIEWKYISNVFYESSVTNNVLVQVFLIVIVNNEYTESTDMIVQIDDNSNENAIVFNTSDINTKKAYKLIKENLDILNQLSYS